MLWRPAQPASAACGGTWTARSQLVVYGTAIAVHVDPIEKKPLHHFLPGSGVLSLGTVGCNLACRWCQNWDISQHKHFDPEHEYVGEAWPPERIVDYCVKRGIPSIAYTYNEPAVFFEYAFDTARLAHEAGLRNIFVSSGFETLTALDTIAPYLDAVNLDLKAFAGGDLSRPIVMPGWTRCCATSAIWCRTNGSGPR